MPGDGATAGGMVLDGFEAEVRRRLGLAQQFELSSDVGLRLGLERVFAEAAATEVQLQLRWYFY